MNYRDTKVAMLAAYPRLFLDEAEVLHHLFFVNGNGYHWENGELTDGSTSIAEVVQQAREDHRRHCRDEILWAEGHADGHSLVDRTRRHWQNVLAHMNEKRYESNERRRERKYRLWCVKNMGDMAKDCWFLRKDGSIGRVMYPLCQYADILHIPDDVKPDWLKAAVKAMEVAETLKTTKADRAWLRTARAQIKQLLQRRSDGDAKNSSGSDRHVVLRHQQQS
jgi:hypothetical protein